MEGASQQVPIAKRLEGKVALITGGSSGIGAATVRLFFRHGAKVVIADIQDDLGQSIAREVGSSSHENVTYIHCDVTKETDVKNAIDTAVAKYGKLDIMYNNAGLSGVMSGRNVLDSTSEDFKRVFDVNVYGSFLGAKHAARVMVPAKKGTIIFASSIASIVVGQVSHAYVMSKHAVVGMSKSLSAELGQYGIRVNCVSPYGVATPMVKSLMNLAEERQVEEYFGRVGNLKGAVLKAEDIAEAVLYLASDEAKYVSGINLVVDGGYSITKQILPEIDDNIFTDVNIGQYDHE